MQLTMSQRSEAFEIELNEEVSEYRVRVREHTPVEARYNSPEAFSCGAPPEERVASNVEACGGPDFCYKVVIKAIW